MRYYKLVKSSFGTIIIYMGAVVAFCAVLALFIMLGVFALPVFLKIGDSSPFSWVWDPSSGQFGILPMLVGSLLLSGLSLIMAFPLSVAISSWLVAIGKGYALTIVKNIVCFMTVIPTVVYGFVAVFLLTPLISQALNGSGMCWFTAALMLTVLILPTMILIMSAGMQSYLDRFHPNALALGFTKIDLLCSFVLPGIKKTLLSATLLGTGRAIGDTLIPLMLAGNATQVPQNLSDSLRTLSAHMALVTANEVGGSAYSSLFAAGFLLLMINVVLSVFARKFGVQKTFKPHSLRN